MLVALVQSASTLPVFLLGLPSGALADILDRRRYFMATQFWVAAVAVVLAFAIVSGGMTAPLLLALTFANGIGLAMRWPVFAAIVPELAQPPAVARRPGAERRGHECLAHRGPAAGGRHHRQRGQRLGVCAQRRAVGGSAWSSCAGSASHPPPARWGASACPAPCAWAAVHQRVAAHARRDCAYGGVFFMSTAILALLPLTAKRFDGIWLHQRSRRVHGAAGVDGHRRHHWRGIPAAHPSGAVW